MPLPANPVVGIRFPQWSSVGPGVLGGVVDFMRQYEAWRLVTENDSYGEMEAVKIDADWHGDGVILFRATESELQAYRRRGMAVVLTSTEGPDQGYPRVVPDNHEIGRIAARHLLECQLPHFAFLARGETFYREEQFAPGLRVYARMRLRGYREALGAYNHEPRVHYLRGRPLWEAHTWREIQSEVMAFLDSLPSPCGLFVVDDSLGAVVMRAADSLGRKVPQDLAVIGFGDDLNYCFSTFPALSSIAHPSSQIGMLAADLLRQQMAGDDVQPGSRVLPPGAVRPRESSDTLAISDPEVRELVRHIRLRAPCEALRVAELAEMTPLSMTSIKERFLASLGHGPKQEIQRVRLHHLKHLLADPSLTLAEISRRMQFASAHDLGRFFHSGTGQRPGEYRKERAEATGERGVKAVIFDMDGTLFDTEPLYWKAYRDAYAEQGGTLEREMYFSALIGRSNDAIEAWLAERAPEGFDLPGFRSRWREIWRSRMEKRPLALLPGVKELLARLFEMAIPVGLASSSDQDDIRLCLDAAGLSSYFTVRAAGDEVAEGKPAPDVYQLACRRLGVAPADCLAIEDSIHGMTAARAAGIRVLWVATAGPQPGKKVRKIASLADLDDAFWSEWLAGGSDG